jgi:hypothetical protein
MELVGGKWTASRLGHFIPGRKSPQNPLDRRLGEPQDRSGQSGAEENLDPTGTRTPIPWPSSPLPVAIPTALSSYILFYLLSFKF